MDAKRQELLARGSEKLRRYRRRKSENANDINSEEVDKASTKASSPATNAASAIERTARQVNAETPDTPSGPTEVPEEHNSPDQTADNGVEDRALSPEGEELSPSEGFDISVDASITQNQKMEHPEIACGESSNELAKSSGLNIEKTLRRLRVWEGQTEDPFFLELTDILVHMKSIVEGQKVYAKQVKANELDLSLAEQREHEELVSHLQQQHKAQMEEVQGALQESLAQYARLEDTYQAQLQESKTQICHLTQEKEELQRIRETEITDSQLLKKETDMLRERLRDMALEIGHQKEMQERLTTTEKDRKEAEERSKALQERLQVLEEERKRDREVNSREMEERLRLAEQAKQQDLEQAVSTMRKQLQSEQERTVTALQEEHQRELDEIRKQMDMSLRDLEERKEATFHESMKALQEEKDQELQRRLQECAESLNEQHQTALREGERLFEETLCGYRVKQQKQGTEIEALRAEVQLSQSALQERLKEWSQRETELLELSKLMQQKAQSEAMAKLDAEKALQQAIESHTEVESRETERLLREREAAEAETNALMERFEALETEAVQLRAEAAELRQVKADLQAASAQGEAERRQLEDALALLKRERENWKDMEVALKKQLQHLQAEVADMETAHRELENEVCALKHRETESLAAAGRLAEDKQAAEEEVQCLRERAQELETLFSERTGNVERLEEQLHASQREAQRWQAEASIATDQLSSLQKQLAVEVGKSTQQAQIQVAEAVQQEVQVAKRALDEMEASRAGWERRAIEAEEQLERTLAGVALESEKITADKKEERPRAESGPKGGPDGQSTALEEPLTNIGDARAQETEEEVRFRAEIGQLKESLRLALESAAQWEEKAREAEETTRELRQSLQEATEAGETLRDLRQRLEEAERSLERARDAAVEGTHELETLRRGLAAAEEEKHQLRQELEEAQARTQRLNAQAEQTRAMNTELQKRQIELETELQRAVETALGQQAKGEAPEAAMREENEDQRDTKLAEAEGCMRTALEEELRQVRDALRRWEQRSEEWSAEKAKYESQLRALRTVAEETDAQEKQALPAASDPTRVEGSPSDAAVCGAEQCRRVYASVQQLEAKVQKLCAERDAAEERLEELTVVHEAEDAARAAAVEETERKEALLRLQLEAETESRRREKEEETQRHAQQLQAVEEGRKQAQSVAEQLRQRLQQEAQALSILTHKLQALQAEQRHEDDQRQKVQQQQRVVLEEVREEARQLRAELQRRDEGAARREANLKAEVGAVVRDAKRSLASAQEERKKKEAELTAVTQALKAADSALQTLRREMAQEENRAAAVAAMAQEEIYSVRRRGQEPTNFATASLEEVVPDAEAAVAGLDSAAEDTQISPCRLVEEEVNDGKNAPDDQSAEQAKEDEEELMRAREELGICRHRVEELEREVETAQGRRRELEAELMEMLAEKEEAERARSQSQAEAHALRAEVQRLGQLAQEVDPLKAEVGKLRAKTESLTLSEASLCAQLEEAAEGRRTMMADLQKATAESISRKKDEEDLAERLRHNEADTDKTILQESLNRGSEAKDKSAAQVVGQGPEGLASSTPASPERSATSTARPLPGLRCVEELHGMQVNDFLHQAQRWKEWAEAARAELSAALHREEALKAETAERDSETSRAQAAVSALRQQLADSEARVQQLTEAHRLALAAEGAEAERQEGSPEAVDQDEVGGPEVEDARQTKTPADSGVAADSSPALRPSLEIGYTHGAKSVEVEAPSAPGPHLSPDPHLSRLLFAAREREEELQCLIVAMEEEKLQEEQRGERLQLLVKEKEAEANGVSERLNDAELCILKLQTAVEAAEEGLRQAEERRSVANERRRSAEASRDRVQRDCTAAEQELHLVRKALAHAGERARMLEEDLQAERRGRLSLRKHGTERVASSLNGPDHNRTPSHRESSASPLVDADEKRWYRDTLSSLRADVQEVKLQVQAQGERSQQAMRRLLDHAAVSSASAVPRLIAPASAKFEHGLAAGDREAGHDSLLALSRVCEAELTDPDRAALLARLEEAEGKAEALQDAIEETQGELRSAERERCLASDEVLQVRLQLSEQLQREVDGRLRAVRELSALKAAVAREKELDLAAAQELRLRAESAEERRRQLEREAKRWKQRCVELKARLAQEKPQRTAAEARAAQAEAATESLRHDLDALASQEQQQDSMAEALQRQVQELERSCREIREQAEQERAKQAQLDAEVQDARRRDEDWREERARLVSEIQRLEQWRQQQAEADANGSAGPLEQAIASPVNRLTSTTVASLQASVAALRSSMATAEAEARHWRAQYERTLKAGGIQEQLSDPWRGAAEEAPAQEQPQNDDNTGPCSNGLSGLQAESSSSLLRRMEAYERALARLERQAASVSSKRSQPQLYDVSHAEAAAGKKELNTAAEVDVHTLDKALEHRHGTESISGTGAKHPQSLALVASSAQSELVPRLLALLENCGRTIAFLEQQGTLLRREGELLLRERDEAAGLLAKVHARCERLVAELQTCRKALSDARMQEDDLKRRSAEAEKALHEAEAQWEKERRSLLEQRELLESKFEEEIEALRGALRKSTEKRLEIFSDEWGNNSGSRRKRSFVEPAGADDSLSQPRTAPLRVLASNGQSRSPRASRHLSPSRKGKENRHRAAPSQKAEHEELRELRELVAQLRADNQQHRFELRNVELRERHEKQERRLAQERLRSALQRMADIENQLGHTVNKGAPSAKTLLQADRKQPKLNRSGGKLYTLPSSSGGRSQKQGLIHALPEDVETSTGVGSRGNQKHHLKDMPHHSSDEERVDAAVVHGGGTWSTAEEESSEDETEDEGEANTLVLAHKELQGTLRMVQDQISQLKSAGRRIDPELLAYRDALRRAIRRLQE